MFGFFFLVGIYWGSLEKHERSVFPAECDVVWQILHPHLCNVTLKASLLEEEEEKKKYIFKAHLVCTEDLKMVIEKKPAGNHTRAEAP